MEAQRFPDDYDGIIAGASANRTPLGLWIPFALLKNEDSYVSREKYVAIHQAVLAACHAQDGLRDGLIADPEGCKFDPGSMLCKDGDSPECLTAPQVEAVRKIYNTGGHAFPPLVPGTELGWNVLGGRQPLPIMLEHFR